MTNPDYTHLDNLLLQLIQDGCNKQGKLAGHPDVRLLAMPFTTKVSCVDAVVDRRLQSLRKREQVAFSAKHGWKVLTPREDDLYKLALDYRTAGSPADAQAAFERLEIFVGIQIHEAVQKALEDAAKPRTVLAQAAAWPRSD